MNKGMQSKNNTKYMVIFFGISWICFCFPAVFMDELQGITSYVL